MGVREGAHARRAGAQRGRCCSGPRWRPFHRDVLAAFNDGKRFRLHYVTAREMVNIIHAAEDGRDRESRPVPGLRAGASADVRGTGAGAERPGRGSVAAI